MAVILQYDDWSDLDVTSYLDILSSRFSSFCLPLNASEEVEEVIEHDDAAVCLDTILESTHDDTNLVVEAKTNKQDLQNNRILFKIFEMLLGTLDDLMEKKIPTIFLPQSTVSVRRNGPVKRRYNHKVKSQPITPASRSYGKN